MTDALDSSREPLLIRTLGSAGLYVGKDAELLLAMGKPFALLVCLALAPGRRMSRDSAIDMLWSDVERSRARNAFRQALFQLRRLLGDDAIPGTEELVLERAVDTDRDRFLRFLEDGDLEAAVDSYHGPFLPAFGVPGGEAFEQWAALERERLQAGYVRGAELLVRRQLNGSRFGDARALALRVRDVAPEVEATGRLLLEVLIANRDFLSAAMEANVLEQRALALGDALESATRATIARARRIAPRTDDEPEADVLVAELTGREREFFAITTAWETLRTGPSRHLHLVASAGLGKTRLLRDAVARLAASGARVVHLRGNPGDRDLPYAFAGDLAGAIAELPGASGVAPASTSALLALNPALSSRLPGEADTVLGEEGLRRRTLALTELVQAVADAQRFVIAIDDLHWIDPWSWRMLEGLWNRLGTAAVLCLTASRPERTPTHESCVVIPIPALTVSQVRAIVTALGALSADFPDADAVIAALFAATRGNPLSLLQTLKYALDQGVLSLENAEWRCADVKRLERLLSSSEALRERVRALPHSSFWLLALLATVGTPLERRTLAMLVHSDDTDVIPQLEPLERLGFVMSSVAGIAPAHDEIGEAALAALSPGERVAAERAIGLHFAHAAGDDTKKLRRSARHLVAADDESAMQQLFRDYIQVARRRGDRRRFHDVAGELLGESASPARTSVLVRSLPVTWRMGLWSTTRRVVVGSTVILALPLALVAAKVREVKTASMQRLFYVDSTQRISVIAARKDLWDGQSTPLTESPGASAQSSAAAGNPGLPPAMSPDGRSVAWIQNSGDRTTLDIWLRTPSGVRRLTHALRDDIVTDWMPDGSALVGATDRWSPPESGGYDIAVFDTASGEARQVTRGLSHDTNPYVSPDGTRIAFSRGMDDQPPRLCVTTIDGQHEPECRVIGGLPVLQLVGWSGLDEIVVVSETAEGRPLVAYDWMRQSRRIILGPHAYRGRLSPDRRWVVAAIRTDGVKGFRDWIAPLDRPAAARPVSQTEPSTVRWWEGPADRSMSIDHMEFEDTSSVVLLGLGTRLRVRSFAAARTEIPLRAPVTWTSSDTLVASVDSSGEVLPHRAGHTTITATLVGWRAVSRQLRVEGEAPEVVLQETWDAQWARRWIPWGDPSPVVVDGPSGIRGFWSRGDGSYPSFAVSRTAFTARHGLGLEVRLSTPITMWKWQRARAFFVAGVDTAQLIATDQRKAPPAVGRDDGLCGLSLPNEGKWGESRASINGGITKELDLGENAKRLRSGDWWTLRIQILPDGRCGVAINGTVLWLSPEPMPLDTDFRVRIGDESNGTRLLHGPLQVWTGVRTDMDWTTPRAK